MQRQKGGDMIWAVRIIIALWGIIFFAIGVRTLFDPDAVMAQFMLSPIAEMGRSSIRADLGAFFMVAGGAALFGLAPKQHHWLLTSLALLGIALLGRAIGLANGGLTPQIADAMLVEAISCALLITAFVFLQRQDRKKARSTQTIQ